MAWPSDSQPARHRLRLELWSWSAWLVLSVVSYPAVLLIWTAPRAGLVAGLIAGLLVVYAATLGYSRRRELERWFLPTLLSALAAMIIATLAVVLDQVDSQTAALCGLILGAETVFIWHFLPWLVHDADTPEAVPGSVGRDLLTSRKIRRPNTRAALSIVLLLGLLAFGLGAVWSRAESRVPGPTAWIIALGVLALAFMFVERLAFLERAARESNLLLVAGSYRKWFTTALLTFILIGGLAAIAPIYQTKARREAERAGSAASQTPAAAALSRGYNRAADAASAAASQVAAGFSSLSRGQLSFLLLLLLLLLIALLLYLMRRTRAVRRLALAIKRFGAFLARIWNRLRAWLERFQRPAQTTPAAPIVDPLLNPFDDPRLLEGLSAREVIIYTYHLLLNFAEMLGQGRRQGQTPFEYARALSTAAPTASESLLALTWAYSGVMYGGSETTAPDLAAVRHSWERISSALTANLSAEDLSLRRRAYLATHQLDQLKRQK